MASSADRSPGTTLEGWARLRSSRPIATLLDDSAEDWDAVRSRPIRELAIRRSQRSRKVSSSTSTRSVVWCARARRLHELDSAARAEYVSELLREAERHEFTSDRPRVSPAPGPMTNLLPRDTLCVKCKGRLHAATPLLCLRGSAHRCPP